VLARPLFYFVTVLAEVCLVLVHEVFVRQRAAYLEPGFGPPAWLHSVCGALAFVVAVWASRRARGDERPRFCWALPLLSVAAALSAPLLFWSFAHHVVFAIAALSVPACVGALLGVVLHSGFRTLGPALRGFEFLSWAANPFRLLSAGAVLLVSLIGAGSLGMWRGAAGAGMVLAVLAGWAPALLLYLDRASFGSAALARRASWLALLSASALLLVSLEFSPLSDYASYTSEVVFAKRTPAGRYVISSGQRNLDLFCDRMLRASSLDDYRFAESFVHPALSLAEHQRRVLLLGNGDGLLEREVLRHASVSELRVVAPDPALAELSATLGWLRARSKRAMSSGKVHLTAAEPTSALLTSIGSFDVILVDLPDPIDYVEGKHYTSYFYRLLASRLAPGGVGVVQATSVSGTPRTFVSIRATLEAAGLRTLAYRAPLPSVGDWGFILFSRRALTPPESLPDGLRFLTPAVLKGLFALPGELASLRGEPSSLHDQRVVSAFEAEQRALFGGSD
jgi:spermidine synthase